MDTSKLSTAAQSAGTLSTTLSQRGGEVVSAGNIPAGTWKGMDKEAAVALLGTTVDPLGDVSEMAKKTKSSLETLVTALGKAKERLHDAENLIAGRGMTINPDGSVTTPTVEDQATADDNERRAREAERIIREAVKSANDADEAAIGSLAGSTDGVGQAMLGALTKVFGPATGGPMGDAAWAPWAISQAAGRFGNLASLKKSQLSRFAPRGKDGKFIAYKGMDNWKKALMARSPGGKNFVSKPGQQANLAKWTKYGKVAGRVGNVTSLVTAGATQVAEDWNRTDLSTGEKVGRAATRTAVQGGSSVGGAWAGAAGGAAIGTAIAPGVGTVIGGAIGGLVGGGGAGWLGGKVSDWLLN